MFYLVLSDIDIVLLGCNEIMSNGDIIGPIGTALVSLLAYNNNIPIIVCCETLSFSKNIHTRIDITPSKFISQVINEKGIIHPLAVHNFLN